MFIRITCPLIARAQTSTEYPVALYREFLDYVKTRYAGEYWHALPKEVAAHIIQIRSSKTNVREYVELAP